MDKSKEVIQDKMINDLALNYAICLVKYGVDIREKWETAIQNKFALEQAYLRGREDERKRIEDLEEQGLLHKAPLKDGTPIYFFRYNFEDGEYLEEETYIYGLTENLIGELGKDYWLSMEDALSANEEAEKKLRELLK